MKSRRQKLWTVILWAIVAIPFLVIVTFISVQIYGLVVAPELVPISHYQLPNR